VNPFEELWDYRSRVRDLYRQVREGHTLENADHAEIHRAFREARDELFRTHPQSALDELQKAQFRRLEYFEYDPAFRFILPLETDVPPDVLEFQLSEDGLVRAQRFGRIRFTLDGQEHSLSLFWLLGYGGGVFLPFRDVTDGQETYGGGRYLLDTIKHADLGRVGDLVVIDFNYAYNPSCAYNPRWVCPLSPPENRLSVPIRAGEKAFSE
jgi:uncharacterized protein (DUF1684 family)